MSLYDLLEITNAFSTYCGAKIYLVLNPFIFYIKSLFLHPDLNKTSENL